MENMRNYRFNNTYQINNCSFDFSVLLASCMEQLTEEGMLLIVRLREEKANTLLHL